MHFRIPTLRGRFNSGIPASIRDSNDRAVPPNHSEALHEALKQAGVPGKLHIVEGAGHGDPEFSAAAFRKMQGEFLS